MKSLKNEFSVIWIIPMVFSFYSGYAQNNNEINTQIIKGEIIITTEKVPDTNVLIGKATGLIDAPIEKVWAVISDYNHFRDFMPRFKESFIVKKEIIAGIIGTRNLRNSENFLKTNITNEITEDTLYFYNQLDFPWPLGDKRYLLKVIRNNLNYSFFWTQVAGEMEVNDGSWELIPYNGITLAKYTTCSDVGIKLPFFLVKMGTKSTLPDIIKAVRKRVTEKH